MSEVRCPMSKKNMPLTRDAGHRTSDILVSIPIPVRDALQKTLLLIGECLLALASNFVEQRVHPIFVGFLLFLLAAQFAGGSVLEPLLEKVWLLFSLRQRLVALKARVALGKVVTEKRLFTAHFQIDPLLLAGHIDEARQAKQQQVFIDKGINRNHKHHEEADDNGSPCCRAEPQPWPQGSSQHLAAIEWETHQYHIEKETRPVKPEKLGHQVLP